MRPIGSPSNPSVFYGVPGTVVFGHGSPSLAASPALFASDAVPFVHRILRGLKSSRCESGAGFIRRERKTLGLFDVCRSLSPVDEERVHATLAEAPPLASSKVSEALSPAGFCCYSF